MRSPFVGRRSVGARRLRHSLLVLYVLFPSLASRRDRSAVSSWRDRVSGHDLNLCFTDRARLFATSETGTMSSAQPVALADGGERDVLVPPPRGRATWRARRDRRGPPRAARERAARVGSAGQRRHHAATATPRRAESNHELDQTFYQASTQFRRERRAHARAQAGQGIANRWPITRQTPALNRVAVAQQACAGAPGTGPGGGMAPAADAKVRGQGVRTSLAAMCDF